MGILYTPRARVGIYTRAASARYYLAGAEAGVRAFRPSAAYARRTCTAVVCVRAGRATRRG